MLRRRPRHPVRAALLCILFLAAVWVGWFVSYRISAEPVPEWDSVERLNELVASRQPEEENAWPIYKRILIHELGYESFPSMRGNDLYDELGTLSSGQNEHFRITGDWNDPMWEEYRARFERLRHLLTLLDEAAAAPGFAYPYGDYDSGDESILGPPGILLPELGAFRFLARLNTIGLRAAAAGGDWDEVVQRLRTGLGMARHLTYQATMIEWIVGRGIATELLTELQRALMENDVPSIHCEEALAALSEATWPAIPISNALDGERLFIQSMLQWLYTPGQRGFLHYRSIHDLGLERALDPLDTDLYHQPVFNRIVNLHPKMIMTPRREASERIIEEVWVEIDAHLWRERLGLDSLNSLILDRTENADVPRFLLEYVARPLYNFFLCKTMHRSASVMLRLEAHHARTGEWPDSLLDAMSPDDATDPVTGLQFRYDRVFEDPHGRPYLLRAPDSYPYTPQVEGWPVLNQPRPPIPDWMHDEGTGGSGSSP
ncbi:MAG: hypothetical protein EA376_05375 [Phycisphaeraceae bacterium]|nr:MAG: hypothetical protein EA376_05375 [Phycisphaeraceae bacterium]